MTRLLWFVAIMMTVALPAHAESPLLAKARAKVVTFELEVALELLDMVLEDPATSRDDRTVAFALKGRVLVGYSCSKTAVANYHALLRHQPTFTLPATESPKVHQCFDHARATAPPPPKPPPPKVDPVPDPKLDPKPDPKPDPGPLTPPDTSGEDSILTAWWLWTGVAGVTAIAVLSVVLVSQGGEDPIRGDLGHATNWPP